MQLQCSLIWISGEDLNVKLYDMTDAKYWEKLTYGQVS